VNGLSFSLEQLPAMKFLQILFAAGVAAFSLTACASPAKVADEVDANGKKIEYVYYTPVGTNIPVKIRKDQLNDGSQTASDQQALRKLTQQSSRPDKQGGN
jgi:hypothetical protein